VRPFALLDDAAGPSRLYTGFVREHRCVDPATLDATCDAVAADLAAGLHGVLLADYEWGARLIGAGTARLAPDDRSALRVLMFRELSHPDADHWLADREGRAEPGPAGTLDLAPAIDRAAFEAAIARIHAAIRDGETYQVNFTYPWTGRLHGDPVALYRRLRARQAVRFGALLQLPMGEGDRLEWVLSRSPELFVRHEAGRLTAQPMKGTLPRSPVPESDGESARLLHEDVKNRAENLMIVDLLRNDLGRIARLGSVEVPDLFAVQSLATVFQMTSTVTAERRPEVGLAALLRAIFPCGSITGAPKHKTMDWIAALEAAPRGLYCGSIGWLAPGAAACPDLCLNVAIRTLLLGPATEDGTRALRFATGGGIVADSDPADEWRETQWKARFVTTLPPGFELFETMKATDGQVALMARHRARLAASARALCFAFNGAAFDARLSQLPAGSQRVRLALAHDGRLTLSTAPLVPLPDGPVRLRLADAPLPRRALAGHKTTLREAYDAGVRAAEAVGAFDTLFVDADGRLIEGGRSNVFVKLDGRWCTPPLADGVLPGVMRAELLADPAWQAEERTLTRADLARAEALVVCNALRGALPAVLD
jgi:para-aminobenzoate synthetase/4-amino-4-deoxychorismate lyase